MCSIVKEKLINEVVTAMSKTLDVTQLRQLQYVISIVFKDIECSTKKQTLSVELCDNGKLLRNYLVCKKISNMAVSSLRSYYFRITNFITFIGDADLLSCDINTFRLYFLELEKQGNSPVTIDNVRRILKAFYQWLVDEEYLDRNPLAKIPKIQHPLRLPRFVSESEIALLRSGCRSWREIALLEFCLSTGLRVSEITEVKFMDIDWKEGSFTLVGKGNKERVAYLNDKALQACLMYIRERNDSGIVSSYLFCPSRGEHVGNLTAESINKILHEIGYRVGIYDVTVHAIRRYFATNLANHNVPPEIIQLLMGHSSFNTTVTYYIRPNNSKAREAIRMFT